MKPIMIKPGLYRFANGIEIVAANEVGAIEKYNDFVLFDELKLELVVKEGEDVEG